MACNLHQPARTTKRRRTATTATASNIQSQRRTATTATTATTASKSTSCQSASQPSSCCGWAKAEAPTVPTDKSPGHGGGASTHAWQATSIDLHPHFTAIDVGRGGGAEVVVAAVADGV